MSYKMTIGPHGAICWKKVGVGPKLEPGGVFEVEYEGDVVEPLSKQTFRVIRLDGERYEVLADAVTIEPGKE